jgi:RNA polymerase sigma factor (sigma-70 family)
VTSATQQAIDAVWRIESARLIAGLARVVRDVGLAEDLAQDALVAALEQWPESGVPDNPGAWLTAVARRSGVDAIRRAVALQSKVELLGRELSDHETPMDEIEFDAHVEDDVLRLMFTACHPVLSVQARVALTLKMVAGLSTEEIARAFLVQTTTMAARITRAKKALTEANVPFEVPVGEELAARLSSVLEAVYLVFNEGYTATAGEQWARAELCQEAMRLGRMLAALAAGESEGACLGGADGDPGVPPSRPHGARRRDRHAGQAGPCALGPVADHAWSRRAGTGRGTRRQRLLCHPGEDRRLPRPGAARRGHRLGAHRLVVRRPRRVDPLADRRTEPRGCCVDGHGPAAGLAVTDGLLDVATLRTYHLLPSVRGDLLAKLGRSEEARAEFERAAELTSNEAERAHLLARARPSRGDAIRLNGMTATAACPENRAVSCLFCDIVAQPEHSSIVQETDSILVLCDIHPVNPGHLLVIPKTHAAGLDDLDPSDGADMFAVAQRVANGIRRTDLRCEGINLFLADGEAAFQEIFHIHLHVVPRYRGDSFRLDSGQSTEQATREELDHVAATIRAAL